MIDDVKIEEVLGWVGTGTEKFLRYGVRDLVEESLFAKQFLYNYMHKNSLFRGNLSDANNVITYIDSWQHNNPNFKKISTDLKKTIRAYHKKEEELIAIYTELSSQMINYFNHNK